MYGIFTYIWDIYGINVSKYAIHGSSGVVSVMAGISPGSSVEAVNPVPGGSSVKQ